MTEAALEISRENIRNRTLTRSEQNAWAAYVRRRWPTNTLKHIQDEWGLNEHKARSVLYAHPSLITIDDIKDHRNGGILLALDVLCLRFSVTLEELAAKLEERAADERDDREADAQRWRRARRGVAGRAGMGGGDRA